MENQKFFFKDDTSSHDNFFTTKGKKGVLFIPPKYLKEGIKYARENNMRAIDLLRKYPDYSDRKSVV